MRKFVLCILIASFGFACSWDHRIWIPRSESADPLYRFIKDGKAGYIDREGRIVVGPTLSTFGNRESEFRNGLLNTSGYGARYIDTAGKAPFQLSLERGLDFSEGLAAAMDLESQKWGYIDPSGNFAIPPRFPSYQGDHVWPFAGGYAKVKVKGKHGFIDKTGEFVVQPTLLEASDFHEGMAWVIVDGPCIDFSDGPCPSGVIHGGRPSDSNRLPSCKFTYIDKSSRILTNDRFDRARNFSEGLAPVRIGKQWGFIGTTGKIVIPVQFDDALPFVSGLARVKSGERFGYVNKEGKVVIPAQFEYAESYQEGIAVVGSKNASYRYIDGKGQPAIKGEFYAASPFFKGLAHVRLSPRGGKAGHFAYIDTTGRVVFEYGQP
jgi:hypothetical protein